MYKIAKITFRPLNKDAADILDSIDTILLKLYMNGQISEGWLIEQHDQDYIANVVSTDDDSLNAEYYNRDTLKEIERFDMEINIACDDPMADDSCHCINHSYYILAIDPSQSSSPVICGDCGKEIPLIRIPHLYKDEDHYSILNFQKTYQAVDRLWINGLSDRFTKRQIIHHNSQLNKMGLDIRAELESKVDKPVHYSLRNPIGGRFDFEKNNKNLECCPKCSGEFVKIDNPYADKVCQACRLAFITCED
jgi:predicted  nucleic acid-binding Zn ribbon protein